MSQTPTRHPQFPSSAPATPSSSIRLRVDPSTRTLGNDLPVPNFNDIPSEFWTCHNEPTRLVLAPNQYRKGFWILTCHHNIFNPDGPIKLICTSFVIPQPKVEPKQCSHCRTQTDLLQTYGSGTIGHWYFKCPKRDTHNQPNQRNPHTLLMITSDSQEAQEIKKHEELKLPVSHIFKNGSFVLWESYPSLQKIETPQLM